MTNIVEQRVGDSGVEGGPAALNIIDLTAGYGRTTVLRGVSLRVPRGTVTALVGPNAAGKTTLMRVASGLLPPMSGSVQMAGRDVTREAPHRRARSGLSLIPEGRAVYKSLTVRENLLMQAPRGGVDLAIEAASSFFPVLGKRLHQKAGTLSGGEQQMLALTAAYVRNPSLILVDEVSLGLAPIIVDRIFDFLLELASRGAALLIVDQYVTKALGMADHAYVLRRGSIVFDGAPNALLESDLFEQYLGTA
ncbi:ABC transporter ATP-binding protein [Rhodococcus wratislaviensis]|uniref:ABC transporter ATP-binding protein n=1 Tax=Rhodococcus wratislaviensis TaxID=44752 RepID=UPI003663A504